MKSPESEALKRTKKGQLRYDGLWHLNKFQETLAECTKPPVIKNLKVTVHAQNDSKPKRRVEYSRQSNTILVSVPRTPSDKNTKNEVKKTRNRPAKPERRVMVDDSHTVELSLLDKELEHRKKEAIDKKMREVEKGFQMARVKAEKQWLEVSAYKEKEQEQSHLDLEADITAESEKKEHYLRHKAEINVRRQQMQDAQLEEAKLQSRIMEEKRLNEIQQTVESIKVIERELIKLQDHLKTQIATCPYSDAIQVSTKQAGKVFNDIIIRVQQIISESHSSIEVATANLDRVLKFALEAKKVEEIVQKAIDAAYVKGEEENAAKEQARKEVEERVKAEAEKQAAKTEVLSTPVQVSDSSWQDNLVCLPQAFVEYQRLQGVAKDVEMSYKTLVTDPQYKKYKFNLQKAVNTPVNAISSNSGAHMRDKLQRICKLLSGQQVEVGGQMVSASQHPAGVTFCKHLFARKIVKQGDEQVSANHESAFAIAAVTVGVMTHFPDVTELLLAEFQLRCPFLVPYYIQKQKDQSVEDYFKTLGYKYEDGVVEQQDKYLRRMSGIMRLYASIVISSPPQGPNHLHPHGLDKGWSWLTCLLNLSPHPDITATMLHDFLQVTGSFFIKVYKKQFVKLLRSIKDNFMPKLQGVTSAGSGGPVVRLQTYMETCITSGTAPTPEGLLPDNIWYT